MLIFVAIAIASFIVVAGGFFFGHDHDGHHDFGGHDHGHGGHGGHHEGGRGGEATISFFSLKVMGTLTMGFGAAGSIAKYYGHDMVISSLIGVGFGIVLSVLMYFSLNLIYKQQATSAIDVGTAVGQLATVSTTIAPGKSGEISIEIQGRYTHLFARSNNNEEVLKGTKVKVIRMDSGQAIVEKES
jgi:membrane protein implicated in regulation of membrane protease activity